MEGVPLMRFYTILDKSSHGRGYFLLAFSILLISLVAGSRQRFEGDGVEYLAMAVNLSEFHFPAPSPEELANLQERFAKLGPGFVGIPLAYPQLVAKDGRQDFPHFWFYSALATPGVWVTRALRLNPNYSFTIVNIALLALALWVVVGRLHWTATLLLFGGPIFWWIDKGHTEVFTFSLLAIAFALLREKPWWSMVCLGAASTQNPPIALVLPIVVVMALITRPGALRDVRFLTGAVVGGALASLHPLYYMSRWGTLTILLQAGGGASMRLPSLDELGAVIWDPNVGLLPAFPALSLVLLGIAVSFIARACQRMKAVSEAEKGRIPWGAIIARAGQLLNAPAVWVALLTAGLFLVSFSQTTNFNSGATPGMSRYGLWLIPLAIPLLQEADTAFSQKFQFCVAPVAIFSLVWCVFAFHPTQPGDNLTPTRLATFLWKYHPSLNNPVPEVFFERVSRIEQPFFPIATATCSKVLLVEGRWPANCQPEGAVPPQCMNQGAFCYANRTAHGYEFVEAQVRYGFIKGEEVYPIGERISFTQGGTSPKYTRRGWYPTESWGTWTEGSNSVVTLKLSNIPDRDMALSIEGHCFLTEKHPVQDVEVLVNQHPVDTLRYAFPSSTETRVVTIPKSFIEELKGRLIIEFKNKNPKSPAELGVNTDARPLGLGIVSLRLSDLTEVRIEGEREDVYPIDTRISFAQGGTGLKYAGTGWSSPESWGTWTDGSNSIVTLKLSDIPKRDMSLSIEGMAYLTDKHPVQDIEVLVNQRPVETLRYTSSGVTDTRVVTIPQSFIQKKKRLLTIEFKIKDPKSPAELGLSTDFRRLGLGLVSLQLR
jgi:hypothetical protein